MAGPYNLTLINTPSFANPGPTNFGTCLTLNGTTQYATFTGGGVNFANGASFTVALKVKSSTNALQQACGWKRNDLTDVFLGIDASGRAVAVVNGFNGNAVFNGSSAITDGNFHSLALVVTGSVATLYVDGTSVQTASGSYTQVAGPTPVGYVGAYGTSPAQFFNGSLDEIAIYNTNLTSAGVINPSSPISNTASNLVALWHCDTGNHSGATLLDCAGTSFSVTPNSGQAGTSLAFASTGSVNTQWTTVAPGYTLSGSGNSVGSQVVTTAIAATGVSAGSTTGVLVITDASNGATAAFTVTAPTPVLTMTGPIFAINGAVSGTFTLHTTVAPGSNHNVTVSDGGTGTTNPSPVQILAGQTSATFTYTPGSAGAKTLTATGGGDTSGTIDVYVFTGTPILLSGVANYGPGYPGVPTTIGFTIYDTSASVLIAHMSGSRVGMAEIGSGTGGYAAPIYVDPSWSGSVWYDAPAGAVPQIFTFSAATTTVTVGAVNAGVISSASFTLGTVNAAATGILERLMMLWNRFFPTGSGSVTFPKSGNGNCVVKNSAAVQISTQAVTDDGTTQTLGPAS